MIGNQPPLQMTLPERVSTAASARVLISVKLMLELPPAFQRFPALTRMEQPLALQSLRTHKTRQLRRVLAEVLT